MTGVTAADVARLPRTQVTGTWYRHCSARTPTQDGSLGGGRWGSEDTFPVLYLGRPPDSVVVEAYRHLVEPAEGITAEMVQPRRFLTYTVTLDGVVDLRDPMTWAGVELSEEILRSEIGDYSHCQSIASRAHQLGASGVIAPAATGYGETLAVFADQVPQAQFPKIESQSLWEQLPPDPRRLRLIDEQSG